MCVLNVPYFKSFEWHPYFACISAFRICMRVSVPVYARVRMCVREKRWDSRSPSQQQNIQVFQISWFVRNFFKILLLILSEFCLNSRNIRCEIWRRSLNFGKTEWYQMYVLSAICHLKSIIFTQISLTRNSWKFVIIKMIGWSNKHFFFPCSIMWIHEIPKKC